MTAEAFFHSQAEELIELLEADEPRLRRFALRRLADLGETRCIPEVRRTMVDEDPIVAFEASRTLKAIMEKGRIVRRKTGPLAASYEQDPGRVGVSPAQGDLLSLRRAALEMMAPYAVRLGEMVLHGSVSEARVAAMALGKLGDVRFARYLEDGLERVELAAHCAIALASIGDPSCLDTILRLFSSRDDRLVQHAIYAAGVFGDDRVDEALLGLLSHPSGPVRSDVVLVLGCRLGAGAVPHFAGLLEDGCEQVVINVLEFLAEHDQGRFADFVSARFASSSDRIRATMAGLLAKVGDPSAAVRLISAALGDRDARVRANAVEAVAAMRLSDERKKTLLDSLAGERNNRVLANLAVAMAGMDTVASLEILSGLLASPLRDERASAVFAAGFIAEEKIAMWLANIFILEEDPGVLANAVTSLARHGSFQVLDRMVQGLQHYNPAVRSGSARVLGHMARGSGEKSQVREALLAALSAESDPHVTVAILSALKGVADSSALRRIAECLHHPSPAVQAEAIVLLDSIGTIEILPYVDRFIFSPDGNVKAAATLALWRRGHLDVVHVIGQMLSQGLDESETMAAGHAFGEIGLSLFQLDDPRRGFLLASALSALGAGETGGIRADEGTGACGGVAGFIVAVGPCLAAMSEGRTKEAFSMLQSLMERNPGDGRFAYLAAHCLRRLGRIRAAMECCRTAGRSLTGNINLFLDLAWLHHELGEPEEAFRCSLEAARLRARAIDRLTGMAEGLFDEGRHFSASLTARFVVESFGAADSFHMETGRHLAKVGRFAESVQHLLDGLLAAPFRYEAAGDLAAGLDRLGLEDAAAVVRMVIATRAGTTPGSNAWEERGGSGDDREE